jgi:hypothetical protein
LLCGQELDCPHGKYYKTIGALFNQDMQEGLSGIAMAICSRIYKMSKEEVDTLLVDVKKDFNNKSIHAYEAM